MPRILKYSAYLAILMLQSISFAFASEQVRVKGVVRDITSDKSLPGVIVELYVFEQSSRLRMGTFVLREKVSTEASGKFEFAVPPRSTIQLKTQVIPMDVPGSLVVLDVEDRDIANIVLTYDPNDLDAQDEEDHYGHGEDGE